MIDLHVHTSCSDGSLTPAEVVKRAQEHGLEALAITDHDTMAGVREAMYEGRSLGIEVVPGLELSAHNERGSLHLLGFFVENSTPSPRLLSAMSALVNGREERILKMIRLLEDLGMPITEEELTSETKGGAPGRPHILNILKNKGFVTSKQDAYNTYLKRGAPAFVDRYKLSAREAIELILDEGGCPTLAHPYRMDTDDEAVLAEKIKELKNWGLQGIEAFYPRHSLEQTRRYLGMAATFRLAVTGGTDFHGGAAPEFELGCIPHGGPLRYSLLETLKNHVNLCSSGYIAGVMRRGRPPAPGPGALVPDTCPHRSSTSTQ